MTHSASLRFRIGKLRATVPRQRASDLPRIWRYAIIHLSVSFQAGPKLVRSWSEAHLWITPKPSGVRRKEATVESVIVLYAKAGCHLCDEARAYLEDLSADHGVTFDEVDIRRDPVIFERYRYRIPVITLRGVERLEGRIEAGDIRALLEELQPRHT